MNDEFRKAIEELEALQEKDNKEIAKTRLLLVKLVIGVWVILYVVSLIQQAESNAEALTAVGVYLR